MSTTNRVPQKKETVNLFRSDIIGENIDLKITRGIEPYVFSSIDTSRFTSDPANLTEKNWKQFYSFSASKDAGQYGKTVLGFKKYMDDILSNSTIKLACCAGTKNDNNNYNIDVKIPLVDSEIMDDINITYGFEDKNIEVPAFMCPSAYGQPDSTDNDKNNKYLCDDFINAYCMNEFNEYIMRTRKLRSPDRPNSFDVSRWAEYSPICACYPNFALYLSDNPEENGGIPRTKWINHCSSGINGKTPYKDPYSRSVFSKPFNICNVTTNIGSLVATDNSQNVLNISSSCSINNSKEVTSDTKTTVQKSITDDTSQNKISGNDIKILTETPPKPPPVQQPPVQQPPVQQPPVQQPPVQQPPVQQPIVQTPIQIPTNQGNIQTTNSAKNLNSSSKYGGTVVIFVMCCIIFVICCCCCISLKKMAKN